VYRTLQSVDRETVDDFLDFSCRWSVLHFGPTCAGQLPETLSVTQKPPLVYFNTISICAQLLTIAYGLRESRFFFSGFAALFVRFFGANVGMIIASAIGTSFFLWTVALALPRLNRTQRPGTESRNSPIRAGRIQSPRDLPVLVVAIRIHCCGFGDLGLRSH